VNRELKKSLRSSPTPSTPSVQYNYNQHHQRTLRQKCIKMQNIHMQSYQRFLHAGCSKQLVLPAMTQGWWAIHHSECLRDDQSSSDDC